MKKLILMMYFIQYIQIFQHVINIKIIEIFHIIFLY